MTPIKVGAMATADAKWNDDACTTLQCAEADGQDRPRLDKISTPISKRSGLSPQRLPYRPRQTQTGPGRARQNQTAQAGSDGPGGRRAIRPRQSQTEAQADQTGLGHQAAPNIAHVPSCDNVSISENSVNKPRARSTDNPLPQVTKLVNRDAVVGPRKRIRKASMRERRLLAK